MKKPQTPQTQDQLRVLIENDLKNRLKAFLSSHNVDPNKVDKIVQALVDTANPTRISGKAMLKVTPKKPVQLDGLTMKDLLPSTYFNS
ncbi:hypothetical protein [Hymenobacter sp. 102]|uniref:hypothetical protein n=1 Tax=Hymenobacter sp. 102 TaxID=3403152 RepID=UPI003CF96751